MIHLIEQLVLMIGRIGAALVVANSDAMVMCFSELAAQSDVINAARVGAEIRREAQRQMMYARKLHHSGGGDV